MASRGRTGGPKKKQKIEKEEPAEDHATMTADPANVEYLSELAKAIETIRDHKMFHKIAEHAPRALGRGGLQGAYDKGACTTAIKQAGAYECGGNMFWLDFLYSSLRGVPYNRSSIMKASERMFKEPGRCRTLIVALPDVGADAMTCRGALQCVSPEEEVHAWLWALHGAVLAGNEKDLEAWKACALSQPFRFEVIASDDEKYFKTCNLREIAGTTFRLVTRTPYQTVYEIHRFHARMETKMGETLSSSKVAELYGKHVNSGTESEPRTASMIDQCMLVYKRAFADPDIESIVKWADGEFAHGSPFSSVAVLHAVVSRNRDVTKLRWLFHHLVDMVRMGNIDAAEVTTRQITGNGGRTRGLADLVLLKQQMLDYMLKTWMPNNNFPQDVLGNLVGRIDTHRAYRSHYIGYPNGAEPNLAWKRGRGSNTHVTTFKCMFVLALHFLAFRTHVGPDRFSMESRN